MGEFWLVKDKEQLHDRIKAFEQFMLDNWDFTKPAKWVVSEYKEKRSLSQNSLFHVWCREIADHFSKKVDVDQDKMKELLKYKLLGTEDIVVGSTVIRGQLRETSKLDTGEMLFFMDQVQAWAADHGVNVSCPADSEYMRLKGG